MQFVNFRLCSLYIPLCTVDIFVVTFEHIFLTALSLSHVRYAALSLSHCPFCIRSKINRPIVNAILVSKEFKVYYDSTAKLDTDFAT